MCNVTEIVFWLCLYLVISLVVSRRWQWCRCQLPPLNLDVVPCLLALLYSLTRTGSRPHRTPITQLVHLACLCSFSLVSDNREHIPLNKGVQSLKSGYIYNRKHV